jgi:diguanylate cyclase (GGDEF)-like protein
MIDIDNVKEFNDNYGHEKGDDALFKVAQAIRNALPKKLILSHVMVGRKWSQFCHAYL